MKQIMSVLMILMFLGSIIPLSEATLVAAPGTIIGLLTEGQTQDYILDNSDRYTVALTFVKPTGNKYADFNINGRAYDGLKEYQDRLRSDSVSGYDISGNNEITIITIFPQGSQTPARVQFAIAPKQGVRSNTPYIVNAQPRLATQPTAISIQSRPVPTDTQAYPRTAMPSSGSPQPVIAQPVYSCESSCNEKYNTCLQEQATDTAYYSRFVEKSPQQCESSYKNCLSACKPQPTPPAGYPDCEARFKSCADYYGKDEQACKNVFYDCRSPCEERYNACAKYYGNEEDVCQKIISSCQKPVQSVCGNGACEKGEEWKTCPIDCKEPSIPPQPVPDCGSTCKDSYSYCMNQAPFEVGQVWAEKLDDDSIRFGAKVVEMTQTGSSKGGPSLNVNIIAYLDGKEMKLAYDEKSAYYYSEPLREELTGQHKLSAKISKQGLGSVGVDHVIDFSGKINEWTAPPAVGMFPYASEGRVYTTEKPTADYSAILEKQCSEMYNQCAQGCGYGSVPPASTCEDKCGSIPCATQMVVPITGSVKLRYGETASVIGNIGRTMGLPTVEEALYVSFQDVDDSRCPPNADCIREGQVSARIYAQYGRQEFVRSQLPIDLVLGQPTKYTVDGETLVFTLKELAPEFIAGSINSVAKENYVAVIDVEGPGTGADCKIQYKQCIESCKGKPYPTVPPMIPPTEPPAIVCDNSCHSESLSKCIPYGIRLVERNKPVYCGISGNLEKQKEAGAAAQNNYECLSNAATNGECLDVQAQISMLQKIWKLFSSIFGGA